MISRRVVRTKTFSSLLFCSLLVLRVLAVDANRLTYLDSSDPFYPDIHLAKLTTPQWIADTNVQAAVVLAIDDMSDSSAYETFLHPILDRLKKIDGRAPVSIMSCNVNPSDPQLQRWLKEGLSIEVHTTKHPCPLLANNDLAGATATVNDCIDLMNRIPGNTPVAFRMPCCDSINSASPRFFSEIFNHATANKNFLTIDSSVFNITTTNDTTLPRTLTMDGDGKEKFRKYLPFAAFSTTIEDYPYPYIIDGTCLELPCAVPSDWEAQNLHKSNNPQTVADWKAQLDAVVLKQGVFNFVFHPHGWIRNDQIIEFIDYAVTKYGSAVKFLNFREASECLRKNVFDGQSLRDSNGEKNGVRLIDLNNDGLMDVVIANRQLHTTRLWNAPMRKWDEIPFPVAANVRDVDFQFGIVQTNGFVSTLVRTETNSDAWNFDGKSWIEATNLVSGLEINGDPIYTRKSDIDRGVRFRDVDNDGCCELVVGNETQSAVFKWTPEENRWNKLPYGLPERTFISDKEGRDAGLRFVDLNDDGFDDVVFSNPERFSVHLFVQKEHLGFDPGWTMTVKNGKRGESGELPMIVRDGEHRNNGSWFRNDHMWVQNEDTAKLPQIVDRRSFKEMISLAADPAKSPAESLACLKLRPGFKAELVASEPLIESPVAFDWSADGKLWVVEMRDYPLGLDGNNQPGGRVVFLTDTDGDGRYDKSTVFLDELSFPNGIIPWRKGVIISAAPEIFYAEDTDGDGKADVRKTLFTGFGEGNQQHRLNGFDYGLDNWIYGANGDSGGEIVSIATGKKVPINGRDFRFHPDTGEFESECGETQFGRHRDDWGNWFGNNNPSWLWHYVYAEHYLIRNPHLAVRDTRQSLANYPDSTRVFEISRPLERFNWVGAAGHVTSGNSPSPYRDELFGPDFATSVFASEPVHNVVHREVLEPHGVTFQSHRAKGEEQCEFIASTDNWFRPTMTKTGPDGALYVCDMYRLVLEHPEWIPVERQKVLDLRAGADKGRIYRVFPIDVKLRQIPNFAAMGTAELVGSLDSPNGWQRDTAQRVIIERRDKGAVEPLIKLFETSRNPKARMQALCALDGLRAITLGLLRKAFCDPDSRVREHAVRISESVAEAVCAELQTSERFSAFRNLVNDPDARVRFQLAFTLGEMKHVEAGLLLSELARKNFDDAHMQTAIMSSAVPHIETILTSVFQNDDGAKTSGDLVERLMGLATALNDEQVYTALLDKISKPAGESFATWQLSTLAAFLEELDRGGSSLAVLETNANGTLKATITNLTSVFRAARSAVQRPDFANSDNERGIAAVRLLGYEPLQQDSDARLLIELLMPQVVPHLQKAAFARLTRMQGPAIGGLLLSKWRNFGPELRVEVLGALLERLSWSEALLRDLENKTIPVGQIGAAQQQKLLKHSDEKIRKRAMQIFTANPDRQKIVQTYQKAATLTGDADKGRTVFQQNCATCHRTKDVGIAIGPDLGMIADKPFSVLLTAIFDPNEAVEARYISYTVITKNDRELTGVITTETANSITLKAVGGAEETLLRRDLKEMRSSGLSLMPEGFESAIHLQDAADLISFLKSK